jgi:hypothetical protein
MGGFDGETWAAGALALSGSYRLPAVLEAIGAEELPLLETRTCSFGGYSVKDDLRKGSWEVHTLTRKTPDYLLAAALDHRPGDRGIQEHLWQLSFSPEAVLFTTWPGNESEDGNARPNFWAGSARLPRTAMLDRTIICLYDPSFRGGLGFGHAYCPLEAFDENVFRGPWVFVRFGRGYGALRGDGDLLPVLRGPNASQEVRSRGPGAAWIAHAGSEAEDGSFAEFQKKLLRQEPMTGKGSVSCATPEGRSFELSWNGPAARTDETSASASKPLRQRIHDHAARRRAHGPAPGRRKSRPRLEAGQDVAKGREDMRIRAAKKFRLLEKTDSTLIFSGDAGERFLLSVLEDRLIRFRFLPDGAPRLDRTWSVADPGGSNDGGESGGVPLPPRDVPLEGRSRDDLSGFALPPFACTVGESSLLVETGLLKVEVQLEPLALSGSTRTADASPRTSPPRLTPATQRAGRFSIISSGGKRNRISDSVSEAGLWISGACGSG